MGTLIKDLSVEELQTLISNTVRETMEDVIEDMIALSSESFLLSIEQSRKDYKKGRTKSIDFILLTKTAKEQKIRLSPRIKRFQ